MFVQAAEERLQAEAVAVGGYGQARLPAKEIAEVIGGEVHAPGQGGLGKAAFRICQKGQGGGQFRVEDIAFGHGFRGPEFIPEGKKREVESAVEGIGPGLDREGAEQAIEAVDRGGGQTPAKRTGGIGGGRDISGAGPAEAPDGLGLPFDDPQGHVG